MITTMGLIVLVLMPAYIGRLAVLQVRQDPAWETAGTYLGFVCAVLAGGAALREQVHHQHWVMLILSAAWLLMTLHRWHVKPQASLSSTR